MHPLGLGSLGHGGRRIYYTQINSAGGRVGGNRGMSGGRGNEGERESSPRRNTDSSSMVWFNFLLL